MALLDRNFNLSQRMVQELGRSIICNEYSDDSLPTEAELCEKFGVSRSAVREAVKMLSAKGLISSKPRQGIRILPEDQWNIFDPDLLRWSLESRPSLKVLKEFLQVRIAIEPEAAALAARTADETKLAAIEAALTRMRNAEENSNEDLESDIAFHISILYASNNRFYIRLRDFIATALRVSISHTSPIKGSHDGIIEDHTKVYNAIRSGNPERAKQSMLALVDEALSFIEEEIVKQEQAGN
jgi:DNA-binding FadR family transcriptional regulator